MIVCLSPEEKKESTKNEKNKELENDTELWKIRFQENPNLIEYGNGDAEVIDYGMFDLQDNYMTMNENDKEIVLKSKIIFNKKVKDPIFTMTLKDFKGLEICGF